ncbi:MAG: LysR family transcriptional regulator [Actinomycetota bacterium]
MVWHDVELRHLQAFLAVLRTRSFGRAAIELDYSQAAVSQQIATLERSIGTPLFERPGGPRPVEPTDAAAELLPHALAVFEELARARTAIEDVLGGRRGRLSIGSFESVSSAFLPDVVARLTRERPHVSLELFEEMRDDRNLVDGVSSGQLDASFIPSAIDAPGLRVLPLLSDPYVAVIRRDLADQLRSTDDLHAGETPGELAVVRLDVVARFGLVGHVDEDAGQAVVNLAFHSEGLSPRYVFRSADNGALQAMVRAGLGMAVMPLLSIDIRDPELVVAMTEPPIPRRAVSLLLRDGPMRSPALIDFVDIVEQMASEYADRNAQTRIE